ncbi:unnamed protein product, partial [Tetraodon nigroviridis]
CPISDVQGAHIFLPITYSIIFVSGVLGNFFVIVVVGNRGARLVDTFVVNLALADLVFVLTLPLWATAAGQGGHWSFGPAADLLCRLSSYVIAVNRFSNIFFLTCMGVDRYLAVVKMMDSRYLRSSRCVRATCAAVWSASLLLGIPYLVYRRVERAEGKALCVEDAGSNFFLGLTLLMVLLTFILPIVIIVLCYSTIILHLNSHCAAAANPRSGARRRHSIKMVLSIITAFVVTWLPYNVFKVITTSSQLSGAEEECGRGPLAPHRAAALQLPGLLQQLHQPRHLLLSGSSFQETRRGRVEGMRGGPGAAAERHRLADGHQRCHGRELRGNRRRQNFTRVSRCENPLCPGGFVTYAHSEISFCVLKVSEVGFYNRWLAFLVRR